MQISDVNIFNKATLNKNHENKVIITVKQSMNGIMTK